MTGIVSKRIDFCDPQDGQRPCGHHAALIKSNVCRCLNENHTVTNVSEFVEACQSHEEAKDVLALQYRINNSRRKKPPVR